MISTLDMQVGQIDPIFPDKNFTTRKLAQNKRIFIITAAQQAELSIINNGDKPVQSAHIYINQHLIIFNNHDKSCIIDISRYVKIGKNTLSVQNIFPEDANFRLQIPYPQLIDGDAKLFGFDLNKLQEIDALINDDIEDGFAGVQLLIAKNGMIVKNTAYGYQQRYDSDGNDIQTLDIVTDNTLFDLASNTKIYASNYALMKLCYENRLDVNKPLCHYLPEYLGDAREQILVKDILMHQAGYAAEVLFFDPNNKYGLYSQDKARTEQLLLTQLAFDYGYHEKYLYSDIDYLILGILIERITGMSLDKYVETYIYQALNLSSSLFNPLQKGVSKHNIAATELKGNAFRKLQFPNQRTEVIRGEVHDEKAFYSMKGVAGHAGLFSTAKELAVLSQIILNGGGYGYQGFFSQREIDQFIKPSDNILTTGLGWVRAGVDGEQKFHFGPYASNLAIGHTGWLGTMTLIDPKYDLIIILLTNKKHSKYIANADLTGQYGFEGDQFETGAYGSISALVYEAFL